LPYIYVLSAPDHIAWLNREEMAREMYVAVAVALVALTACAAAAAAAGNGRRVKEDGGDDHAARGEVTYDGRALVLNGTRRMLFSGEIHYTRSTPEVRSLRSSHRC
jgi:hypothetical protein